MSKRYHAHTPDVIANWRGVPREDFAIALQQIAASVKRGRVYTAQIGHDDNCPCTGNRAAMAACTCSHVNITVAELQ